ncbi:MAG: hypothetical protein GY698_09530 [Actinomycetia bacterium]|nr:hypothetical protein [Actinomycetes bacterium]
MVRRRVRLLHTSDIHLAGYAPTSEAPHLDQCLCDLLAIEQLGHDHEVDGVIIAGDLFDHARVEEDLVTAVFAQLDKLPGEVILLVGNHDAHDDRSIYLRYEHVVQSSSVRFVDDHAGAESRMLDGAIHLWGRAMTEHSSAYRPLHGVAPRPADDVWYLVMGHGHHIGPGRAEDQHRSSIITDDDVRATGADYVALGHHHVTSDVSMGGVTAWYSGAPSGYGGGQALVVDLCPTDGVSVTQVAVEHPGDGCA